MNAIATPKIVARHATMTRIKQADAQALYMDMDMRRTAAARNGYSGPLTRAELTAQASQR